MRLIGSFEKASGEKVRRLQWLKEGQFEKMKNISEICQVYLKFKFIVE
jgi:hypothetical protein